MVVAWIVAFNSSALIAGCLSAIKPWVDRAYVLENGSGDEEREKLAQIISQESDWVWLLVSPKNLGFGPGMNFIRRNSEYVGSEVLWLVNPDIVAVQGTPELAIAALETGEAHVVSPCVISTVKGVETVLFSGGHIDIRSGRADHRDFGRPVAALGDAVGFEITDFVTGAAPLMLVRTWDALGGFREDLFMYWEDVDLSLRATQAGMKLAVDMGFRVSHLAGASVVETDARRSDLFYYYTSRGRVIVCGESSSLTSVLFWPGGIHSIRLIIKPIVRESSRRFIKSGRVIMGLLSGARAVIATRANRRRQASKKRLRIAHQDEIGR